MSHTLLADQLVKILTADGRIRLDIGGSVFARNTPASEDCRTTRLVLRRLDHHQEAGPVNEAHTVGIFCQDLCTQLDICKPSVKSEMKNIGWNSWATQLRIKPLTRSDVDMSRPIQYGEPIGIFSSDGKRRLDIGQVEQQQVVELDAPNDKSWKQILQESKRDMKITALEKHSPGATSSAAMSRQPSKDGALAEDTRPNVTAQTTKKENKTNSTNGPAASDEAEHAVIAAEELTLQALAIKEACDDSCDDRGSGGGHAKPTSEWDHGAAALENKAPSETDVIALVKDLGALLDSKCITKAEYDAYIDHAFAEGD